MTQVYRTAKPTTVTRLVRSAIEKVNGRCVGWVSALRHRLQELTPAEKDELIIRLVRDLRAEELSYLSASPLDETVEEVPNDFQDFYRSEEQQVAAARCGVYFLRVGRRVKIGMSHDVHRRVTQLTTSAIEPPVLLAWIPRPDWVLAREMEASAHRHFAEKRTHREWFDLALDEVTTFVTAHGGRVGADSDG